LRKAKDIIGMPVIEIAGGKQLGYVKDIALDSDWTVQAVVVDTKNWFSGPKVVTCGSIVAFGDDAVTVQSDGCLETLETPDGWRYLDSGDERVKGKPIMTINGLQLGVVEDVYFEEKLGKKIIGYELTDGFISDITEGRKHLPAPASVTWGEDAIIVPLHSEDGLEDLDTQS
jgi:uncharacterized protein YrrD